MPTNDFLVFATGGGANVESQASYAADSNRTNGNQPGVASSAFNNKALRQANFVASQVAQYMCNITGASANDDGVAAEFLGSLTAALQRLSPVITTYTSGSGTHNKTYYFFIASGNATVGATYTNNTFTFTVAATIASGTLLQATGTGAPAVSGTLTKSGGSGDATLTFYGQRSCLYLNVIALGGGGGGGGSGTANGTIGGTGGNTTFGTSLVTANGGVGAQRGTGGEGGTASLGTGALGTAVQGAKGGGAGSNATLTSQDAGGMGGSSALGGAGASGAFGGTGTAAKTNSGSGGGGGGEASGVANQAAGGGGGSGGYCNAIVLGTVADTFAYAVGAVGTAGAAGTSGQAGGAGALGFIQVIEHFQ